MQGMGRASFPRSKDTAMQGNLVFTHNEAMNVCASTRTSPDTDALLWPSSCCLEAIYSCRLLMTMPYAVSNQKSPYRGRRRITKYAWLAMFGVPTIH